MQKHTFLTFFLNVYDISFVWKTSCRILTYFTCVFYSRLEIRSQFGKKNQRRCDQSGRDVSDGRWNADNEWVCACVCAHRKAAMLISPRSCRPRRCHELLSLHQPPARRDTTRLLDYLRFWHLTNYYPCQTTSIRNKCIGAGRSVRLPSRCWHLVSHVENMRHRQTDRHQTNALRLPLLRRKRD